MATSTENFKFKKPDESDFYDIQDQNGNWDIADQELEKLNNPTFEDYTGDTSVPAASAAIEELRSKSKLGVLLSNIKAAFKGACLIGHIVNNCVTDRSDLPLSAAQGKALMDAVNVLNTNQENFIAKLGPYAFIESNNIDDYNEKALENIYRILYGIIDNQAYLSIDIAWVRIELCTNIQTLKWRIVYGSSGTDGWHSFS